MSHLIFQLGTNNWQRPVKDGSGTLEFAPGSGVLHEAHHNAYNRMPGVKCFSMYPSKNQGQPSDPQADYRVFELTHDIPICESASPNSSKRWHTMDDAEFNAYVTRMESEVYDYMKACEAKVGKKFTMVFAHHSFVNPLVLRNVIRRRMAEGIPKCPIYCFVHGTALKMYRWELGGKNKEEFPMRFHKMILEEKLFSDQENGINACFVISEEQKGGIAEIFPMFPQDRVIVAPNGINVEKFKPREKNLTTVITEQTRTIVWPAVAPSEEDCKKYTQLYVFVGKFAEWKRQAALLRAAALLEKDFPNAALLCAGTGPEEEKNKLVALCNELGLKNTFLLGARGQDILAEMYTVANLGCFPSFREPFGLVFVECMACKTPVIGANSGGPKDFVSTAVGELVAEPPETSDLSTVPNGVVTLSKTLFETISRALKEDWKTSKGPACIKLAHDKFTVEAQVSKMLADVEILNKTMFISDGRKVRVLADDAGIAAAACEEFVATAKSAISSKGAFSVCVGLNVVSGSIGAALKSLDKNAIDFSKVHIFFCNEFIGEGKCYKGAKENLIEPLGIPEANVYKVGEGTPEDVAAAYEKVLKSQPSHVVATSASGLPSVDLVFLGSGEDGSVASLHPNKTEIKKAGQGTAVLGINEGGQKSIVVSIDFIRAAKRVILGAATAKRADMVARCLRPSNGSYDCPASMVNAPDTLWLCDEGSISKYRAKQANDPAVAALPSFWSIPGMKAGVIIGDTAWALLRYAKASRFAIPAFNCTGTSSVNAVLEAGKLMNRPVMVQFSEGGSCFFAGKSLPNDKKQAAILGSICGAHYVRNVAAAYGVPVVVHSDHCAKKLLPWFDGMLNFDEAFFQEHGEPLFTSHMLDLSEEEHDENIGICAKYLQRMAPLNLILEMEIGITGGVEDGVDNSGVSKDKLYSTPEDVWQVWTTLSPISEKFTIAAAFGNVHGVYKPGNVVLRPELLGQFQQYAGKILGTQSPYFFVFHGGSGSTAKEIDDAVSYGVVKMNVDTDTQWAYWEGILNFYTMNDTYLQGQIGNPKGLDKPNKSYYDPRKWVREAEVSMVKRVQQSNRDLRNVN
jgi:fructose-bisphosphate aldolase class II